MSGRSVLPNEVLLLICEFLDPLEYEDQCALRALRLVSQAGRSFATAAAFRLWKLGGGRGQEFARREVFSMFSHPMSKWVRCLEVAIDSMLPGYLINDTPPPSDEEERNETEPDADSVPESSTLRKLIHRYSRDFQFLLAMAMRQCGHLLYVIKVSEASNYFMRGPTPTPQHLLDQCDSWIDCFWQAIRLAFDRQYCPSMQRMELEIRSFKHMHYAWLVPYSWATHVYLVNFDKAGQGWADDGNESVLARNLTELKVKHLGVSYGTTFQSDLGAFLEGVALRYSGPLECLELDLGSGVLNDMRQSSFAGLLADNEFAFCDLTKLHLRSFVEISQMSLCDLLENCQLRELYLIDCATALRLEEEDVRPKNLMYNWYDIFAICGKMDNLTDIFFEGLRYLTVSSKGKKAQFPNTGAGEFFKPLPGWTCGVPLLTDSMDDLDELQRLREMVIKRREEKGLPQCKWLSKFLDNDECWGVLLPQEVVEKIMDEETNGVNGEEIEVDK